MKVPQKLREHKQFETNYSALVKALVPTRTRPVGVTKQEQVTPPTMSLPPSCGAVPTPQTPPNKPKRKGHSVPDGFSVAQVIKHDLHTQTTQTYGRCLSFEKNSFKAYTSAYLKL